ncbi:hypothetical protein P175DRAFT_0426375 [Aspergillus ochraceoroseus IBT 24754]|uniref:Zn(2)-C6 fungal-type domain-containing protein n=2 Tax=Aspergillus ochraceoroseus TaxID=138278 RepID=A0A2T5M7U2_9EURO|nr:uncharacterized protein P175DRAFT_0426375 [Aspergillus ochraceoroseus IBT 24754]PTU24595.1 hypothetical protein P175DRAFT_0426375 [Aspergillus ochraceoroseus IBT 24754]
MSRLYEQAVPPEQEGRTLPPINRRRDKPQLSCSLCKRRKLKCDRGVPCSTCTRRGLSLSCTYPSSTPLQSGKTVVYPSTTSMHDRVAQLEKLVMSLKPQTDGKYIRGARKSPSHKHAHDEPQLPQAFGRLSLENTETTYVESSHWTAIIDGIAELKDYFDDETTTANTGHRNIESNVRARAPALIVGDMQQLGREEILATVPPKTEVDRLVTRYFAFNNISSLSIHGPTFLEEYDAFWDAPEKASDMWIGLLFGIMCLGALHQKLETPSLEIPPNRELLRSIQTYRERVAQCLALADYTKCIPYTVETLLHYLSIEYFNLSDGHTGVWILLGITLQIAFRMGYHRDGSYFPRLAPFQAEMRRRTWAVLFQLDSLAAGQFGIPRMINAWKADTKEPRDVSDDALSPDMTELPPSRTDSQPSFIQFVVMKNRLISTFTMVIDITGEPKKAVSYEEIMKLDKTVNDQFQSMPAPLRTKPLSRQLLDPPDVILSRIFLALSYYKCCCVLHRGYMLAARTDDRYQYSRRACIGAALEVLQIQATLHEESQPGRRFEHQQWKLGSLVKHIFLLATTILCVDLRYSVSQEEGHGSGMIEDAMAQQIIPALELSYSIWLQSSDESRESRKVTEMLRIVLAKAARIDQRPPNASSVCDYSMSFPTGTYHLGDGSCQVPNS